MNTFVANLIHVGDPNDLTAGGGRIDLDGSANKQIRIYDGQAQKIQRVIMGKLGTLADEWGLEIYNRLGDLVLNADGLDGTFIHDLTVDTIKVKNGAISNAWTVIQTNAFDISDGNTHTLLPVVVRVKDSYPAGYPPFVQLMLQVRLYANQDSSLNVQVQRAGSLLENMQTVAGPLAGGGTGKWTNHIYIDTDPIVGNVTYQLAIISSGGNPTITVDRGRLFVQQIIK